MRFFRKWGYASSAWLTASILGQTESPQLLQDVRSIPGRFRSAKDSKSLAFACVPSIALYRSLSTFSASDGGHPVGML